MTHVNSIKDFKILLEVLEDAFHAPQCNELMNFGEGLGRNASQFYYLSQQFRIPTDLLVRAAKVMNESMA